MSGDLSKCTASDETEEPVPPLLMTVVRPFSGVRVLDSPILLLVLFHKAIKEELAELHRFTVELLDGGAGCRGRFPELRRRFEFLKLVYKYHSASEDEIIFLALDALVKNIVTTYSLEHISIDDLFDSIFHSLEILMKEAGDAAVTIQELVSFIDTLETIIFQHMLKEEEQVFPLLVQNFSLDEQASLVWQFMCSVPVALLQDFWPWMASFFSSDERVHAVDCIKAVVPKEILLQEVIISWFDGKGQNSDAHDKYGKGALFFGGHADFQKILEVCTSEGYYSVLPTDRYNPIGGVHLWHGAFRKDLEDILQELYEIRSSRNLSNLIPAVVQLNFITDVLIFYSNALDKIVYPIYVQFAGDCEALSYQRFLDESQIEDLQSFLYCKDESALPVRNFVDNLCGKLEICLRGIDKHLTFLETEVFLCLGMYCSHEMQQWLVYTSLEMMPLGLLKCTISWFSTQLSEDESKSIMFTLMGEGSFSCKSLSPLLHEWFRSAYLGKSSTEKFRRELLEMYNHKCSLLSEEVKLDSGVSILELDMQPNNRPISKPVDTGSTANINNCVSSSSSGSNKSKKNGTFYSSGMSFHVFFPPLLKMSSSVSIEDNSSSSFLFLESRPVDHILLFHKVLRKDLEQLVLISASLAQNAAFLMDFRRLFHLVQLLYQIHSTSEDEVAFPALEAKGKTQNLSHSYSIDHKLEVEHFNRISSTLDQISELYVSIPSSVDGEDGRMLKYRQLCMKLHDMCKSMNRILCDHLNHEEIELWPLFDKEFSIEEQENIIGCMLGRTTAETLEEMIPWLMGSLMPEEQHAMITLWRKATKNTMFDQWLGEWWEGMKQYDIAKVDEQSNLPPPSSASSLEDLPTYLFKEGHFSHKNVDLSENDISGCKILQMETLDAHDKEKAFIQKQTDHQISGFHEFGSEVDKNKCNKITEISDQTKTQGNTVNNSQELRNQGEVHKMSQEELETSIRRVYSDSTLDPQKKPFIIQNMLMSRWNDKQKISHPEVITLNKEEVSGQCPSYRDPLKSDFGCQHYKRNCKLVAACCDKLYTCRNCHDDECDHSMDRKATSKMMCMKCLIVQPIAQTCSTATCSNFSMAKYYCKICKLFDDERKIYHCPYCNLCRVGMGLGIDFFHCMNCNACMSKLLTVHICREKCFMDNCPICHEYIFTSSSPVKALPCGHLMHSSCFREYTCSNYTCPICSKSLGDMHAYFGMLDALLAEENKTPHEYSGKTQVILCNDCEKRGSASFHWLYHKCSYCGSYNTRLI